DRPARRIDDVGRWLHQGEFFRADKAPRALGQDYVNGEDVRLAKKILLARVADADFLALVRRQVLAPGDDFHAERLSDFCRAGAELAQPEDAERQAFEVQPDRRLPRRAGLHPRVLVADAPGQFEHQADGNARGRTAHRWRAAHDDAALPGRGDVARRIAQPRGDEQLELRQFLDHGARESGALAHGAHDLELLQRREDLIGSAQMRIEHFDVEVVQNFRPVGHGESDVLVIIENRAAMARHETMSVRWPVETKEGGDDPL